LRGEQVLDPIIIRNLGAVHIHPLQAKARIVGGEEPEPVAENRTSQTAAQVVVGKGELLDSRHCEPRLSRESASAEKAEGLSPEVIAARVGDDIHDGAGGPAELGLIPARLDLKLPDEVV